MKKAFIIPAVLTKSLLLLLALTIVISGQRKITPDPDFNAKVARPAHTSKQPRVLLDEAHANFLIGRTKLFVDLITSDGLQVSANKEKFSDTVLRDYDILVLINAKSGGKTIQDVATPPFTIEEIEAVYKWVRRGGSLLLVFDHYPFDSAVETLAKRFGAAVSKGAIGDSANYDKSEYNLNRTLTNQSDAEMRIVYGKDSGQIRKHPITKGRDSSEEINRVLIFGGSALSSTKGVEFLALSRTATNRPFEGIEPMGMGRAQAAAFSEGKGKVIMLADSNLFTAEIHQEGKPDSKPYPMGMSRTDYDGRQLVLNMMRWLSGALK